MQEKGEQKNKVNYIMTIPLDLCKNCQRCTLNNNLQANVNLVFALVYIEKKVGGIDETKGH